MDSLIETLKTVGQDHVFKFYDQLSEKQKLEIQADVQGVDWENLYQIYQQQVAPLTENGKVKQACKIDDNLLQELPPSNIEGTTRCSKETLKEYQNVGLANICEGKVAVLLLAGGQGTRLGVDYPKGMFDVGLPEHKSLLQLQAERILELCKCCEKAQIIWYIMTSGATMDATQKFLKDKNYFGLSKDKVVIFEQNNIPCLGFDGKVLLDQKHRISRSPNGNGGLYEALHKNGILEHMKNNGIQYIHVYCVDNVLVRVCDPTFIGYCITKQVDAGAKVVEKVNPKESVGIICKVNNQFKVIEYSEISDNISEKRDVCTGKLAFNAGNICEHFFNVDFLQTITGDKVLRYHIAVKKIPHVSLETGERITPDIPNGIKLEKFIFDVFEFTNKFAAWEVTREDEFSPLKNALGTEKDNPTTALKALQRAYELGLLKV